MVTSNDYFTLNAELRMADIGITPAELHGLMTGFIVGGCVDDSWKILLLDMLNEGKKIPEKIMTECITQFESIRKQLNGDDFSFHFLLREDKLLDQIDDLVAWINHFLLGLGLAKPNFNQVKGDTKEAITDLREITRLSYDKNEDESELEFSFEQIKEFVKISIFLCFHEFNSNFGSLKTLH